jgi:hypothetical protein
MAGVRVVLSDATGTNNHTAELPHDVNMQRMIPALLTKLNMPIVGRDGQQISYRMYHNGQEIREDQTLAQAGVQDDATLTLSQEATAGGIG